MDSPGEFLNEARANLYALKDGRVPPGPARDVIQHLLEKAGFKRTNYGKLDEHGIKSDAEMEQELNVAMTQGYAREAIKTFKALTEDKNPRNLAFDVIQELMTHVRGHEEDLQPEVRRDIKAIELYLRNEIKIRRGGANNQQDGGERLR